MRVGLRRLYVDLAADHDRLGAERQGERIAMEVQSFVGESDIEYLHHADGQHAVYRVLLARRDPDRVLYLAVSDEVFSDVLSEPLGQEVIADLGIRLVVFNPHTRSITLWRR
jgi:glucose-6-phosphate 1-dehydrogenase